MHDSAQACVTQHTPCYIALLVRCARAYWMLIAACNLMVRPVHAFRRVMNNVTDLNSLAKMGLKAMEDMLGKVSGKLLFDFFHNRGS